MIQTTLRAILMSLLLLTGITAFGQTNLQSMQMDTFDDQSGVKLFQGMPRKYTSTQTLPRPNRIRVEHPSTNFTSVPTWSDSFVYHDLRYDYTMVGASPKNGSTTTVVPTTLVPLRFVFADGSVYDASSDIVDGQTPIQGIVNSPIFQNHNYVFGGISVGNTQYGDAFQRANFWTDVSKGSRDYHVLLGVPNVTAPQIINVPAGLFDYFVDPDTQQVFPSVDIDFIDSQVNNLIDSLNSGPQSLTVFVTGQVSEFGAWGYHGSVFDGRSEKTFIVAPYLHSNAVFYGQQVPDTYVLSHEVLEWLDDPFPSSYPNFVPGWQFAGDVSEQCDSTHYGDILEVGDAFAFSDSSVIPISTGPYTYHVTDAGFLDFFTRATNSRAVNGQYTFFGTSQATPPCIGHIEINVSTFEFPHARSTFAFGINNHGQIVGYYRDTRNKAHGFLLDHGQLASLDVPGAIGTFPQKINDSAQIAGYYFDAQGLPHGFAYHMGQFTSIDFPGAVDSGVSGINAAGDVVGFYDDASLLTHSFMLHNGTFLPFDSPFGGQSQATAINDAGVMVGANWNAPFGPSAGYIYNGGFSPFAVPGSRNTLIYSINNQNEITGAFGELGWTAGFVTLYGNTYQIYPYVYGNNDKHQIVGRVFDPSVRRFVGYVADLPSRNGQP